MIIVLVQEQTQPPSSTSALELQDASPVAVIAIDVLSMTTIDPSPSAATGFPPPLVFPPGAQPRTWLITTSLSPVGIAVAHAALMHGDKVVLGVSPSIGEHVRGGSAVRESNVEGEEERVRDLMRFWHDEVLHGSRTDGEGKSQRERCRLVDLDGRNMGQCQAAVAGAVKEFGSLDILFSCASEALIGSVEELAASPRTLSLVREQIETNLFGPINCIKAALPTMRNHHNGHIIILAGITGHLGTPGLGTYCAAGWALEGFCDSLAYEVAPFNIKVTIVQPNIEVNILTNKITAVPPSPAYAPENNPAPLCRSVFGGLLDRIEGDSEDSEHARSKLSSGEITSLCPKLPGDMMTQLLAETVHAVVGIAGHENPPARHIVGLEGVAAVKEKLKTVSEELEDFVEVSCAVDIENGDISNGTGVHEDHGHGIA